MSETRISVQDRCSNIYMGVDMSCLALSEMLPEFQGLLPVGHTECNMRLC